MALNGNTLGSAILAALDAYIATLLDGDGKLTAPISRTTAKQTESTALITYLTDHAADLGALVDPYVTGGGGGTPPDEASIVTSAGVLKRAALAAGDVKAPLGSNVLTIAPDAVTYAKMQNVSATDKLLGRSTAGAGDVEEVACTAAGRALLDDADAAAQRATLGLGSSSTTSLADIQAYVWFNMGGL